MGGYIFNRKYFHATDSAISCIYWSNEDNTNNKIDLTVVDIVNASTVDIKNMTVPKVFKTMNESYFDKRVFADTEDGIYCQRDGYEGVKLPSTATKPIYNDNIIAYIHSIGFAFDAKNKALLRTTLNLRKNGFCVRKDNYKEKLPIYVAKSYPLDNWYERDIISTTSDGGDAYTHDNDFLKSCLIYTCLSNQNKCLSFNGSDGRYYRNELCFDTTNGDTIASADLAKTDLDEDEKALLQLWNDILCEAKRTANYNTRLTYGVYQITKELNTSHKTGTGKSQQIIYDYPTLNGYLEALRINLKAYYKSHITSKMFQYELLK